MINVTRIDDVLLNYWGQLTHETDALPREAVIDPEAIESIWDDCFLVQITPDNHYRYDYLGKNLIDAYGEDFTVEEADTLVTPTTHRAIEIFSKVVASKQPTWDSGEFVNSKHMLIKYRQYLLPFGEGEKVTHILGGMRWKVY